MSYKKYKRDLQSSDYYSAKLWDNGTKEVGSMIAVEYNRSRFMMVMVYWGDELDYERSVDGEVEQEWIFDEENTRKLMLRTGARTGKELIEAVKGRFMPKGGSADLAILNFCKEKGIEYDYCLF